MRARLTAATDVATFIIFDPGAIPADVIDPRKPLDAIDEITSRGQAICYSYAADGDTDCLILVDEEADNEFLNRRRNVVENVLLRVPTGRIVVTGYEDLCGTGKRKYRPETFDPTMGDAAEIPAGNYAVTAFEVDWGEQVEQEISKRAVPGDEGFETVVGTSMGCVIASTILVVPAIVGIIWNRSGFYTALEVAGYVLLFHVIFWLITIPIVRYSKRWRRMMELRKDVESRYPNTVFLFRTLDETAADGLFNAGKFGDGFARNEA